MAKKRGNSLPFEEAREFIQTQCIGSRKQYTDWHTANKPKRIPKYPNRVYLKEWDGWNDWLGTDNKFDNKKRIWRPFGEAILWVHRQQIGSKDDWLTFCKYNDLPNDIPTRPDLVYDNWRSWMHWLGNKPREKVEAQQEAIEESALFYIIQEREYVEKRTVFTFGVEKGGRSALKHRWELAKFGLVKMFKYDPDRIKDVRWLINAKTTGYYGAEDVRIVPNINQLVWDISELLDIVP